MNSHIILLVGPKGSGKSHLGRKIEELFGIPFLRIEYIWQQLKQERSDFLSPAYIREGRLRSYDAIRQALQKSSVTFEASGAGEDWSEYLSRLQALAPLIYIKVSAPLEVCYRRAITRDQAQQVQISHELFNQINEKSFHTVLPWHAIIENEPYATDSFVAGLLKPVLAKLVN